MKIRNAMTIDVEDWFHANVFNEKIAYDQWDFCEHRIVPNILKILNILEREETKATFFILGWVARRHPNIVKMISDKGHELATHGYAHKLIYQQTPEEFEYDVSLSKEIIEDISGVKVVGYRAPSYSIIKQTFWAYEILYELGFKYDSSIFPIKHDVYGVPFAPRFPYKINLDYNREIYEFPLSTVNYFGKNVPIAGGGYFRLFPYHFIKWGIKKLNRKGKPCVIYIHPWELDPDIPQINLGWLKNFRTYGNLGLTEHKFTMLFKDFKFAPIKKILKISTIKVNVKISECFEAYTTVNQLSNSHSGKWKQ